MSPVACGISPDCAGQDTLKAVVAGCDVQISKRRHSTFDCCIVNPVSSLCSLCVLLQKALQGRRHLCCLHSWHWSVLAGLLLNGLQLRGNVCQFGSASQICRLLGVAGSCFSCYFVKAGHIWLASSGSLCESGSKPQHGVQLC